jgi:hypothetical protein
VKTKSQCGTREAIKQLNQWSKSEVTVKLIVKLGPFIVWHSGCVRKFGADADNIFYVEPNQGGGTFEFEPSDCQLTIRRTKTYTEICFSQEGVSLFLFEYFRDAEGAEELGVASVTTLDGEVERA